MAIQPSSKSNLEQNQIALNQQIFAPASTENHNIELGNVKAGIVCECTSAANEDGLYSATVLNNLKSDGFAIYNGLIVTCRFSVANTVSSPKFSVNGIGAAPLRTSTTAVGSGCWKANAILQLQYCAFSNGDKFWLIVGSDSASEVDGVITNANGTTIYNKQSVDGLTQYKAEIQLFNIGTGGYINSSANKYMKLTRGYAVSIPYYRNEAYFITDQSSSFLALLAFTKGDSGYACYIYTIYGNPYLSVVKTDGTSCWLQSTVSWNRMLTVYSLNGYKPTVSIQNNLN